MPALGKTNASRVQVGDRILARVTGTGAFVSDTKTGPGVQVVRVTGKGQGGNVTRYGTVSRRMTYNVETTAGTLENLAPIQTMWLAPEDPAGVKRAHVEALAEDLIHPEWTTARTVEDMAREELDLLAPEVTGETALAAIGGCWAGGALTGKALKAHADGDYVLALALAADQKALQEAGGPDAYHPETLAERPHLAQAETLGDVAADLLDMVEPVPMPSLDAYRAGGFPAARKVLDRKLGWTDLGVTSGGVEVLVAPMGTPEPGPEDLSDLAVTLAGAELAEHLEPEEVRAPLDPSLKCQPRDVVTIHRGTRLYRVARVVKDHGRNNLTGELVDHTMAQVAPVDPEDERDAQWVHLDLLHVRRPVARVTTEEVTERVRQTREVFQVEGQDRPVAVRTILVDSARLPQATLIPNWAGVHPEPVATLRVGEALVVDGRCYAVKLKEERATLVPAPHRDRLHQG